MPPLVAEPAVYLAVEDFMHTATQRLWETFWDSPEESEHMPFYIMGPHTSASESLSVCLLRSIFIQLDYSARLNYFNKLVDRFITSTLRYCYVVYYFVKRKCSLQILVQNYSKFFCNVATWSIKFELLVVKLDTQIIQVVITQTFIRAYIYNVVCPTPNFWTGL